MQRSVFITAFVTLALFSVVLYTGCVKSDTSTSSTDKCASITCQHGGTCSYGICYCTSDYTGTYCQTRKCEANNTSRVRFSNKTGTSQTYSVNWDGSILTTLAPGTTSDYFTVTAGVHTLHFLLSNTGAEACTQSTPTLVVCMDYEYWCTK